MRFILCLDGEIKFNNHISFQIKLDKLIKLKNKISYLKYNLNKINQI